MAKNREKQKAHKKCSLTRDERIRQEAEERQLSIKILEKELQELKEEELEAWIQDEQYMRMVLQRVPEELFQEQEYEQQTLEFI